MAVVTSVRLEARPQKDGRLAVRERHTADGGESEERTYLAPANADLDAMLLVGQRQFLERLARKPKGG